MTTTEPIMTFFQPEDSNGVSAGLYEYHSSLAAAELAKMPGTIVVETTPSLVWRAKVERRA